MFSAKRKREFKAALDESMDSAVLAQLYDEAVPYGELRLSPEGVLFYDKGLKRIYVELQRYDWVFRRVQEVNAKICCGGGKLQMHRIVFGREGQEVHCIELQPQIFESRNDYIGELLQALEKLMPHARFGYGKKQELSV